MSTAGHDHVFLGRGDVRITGIQNGGVALVDDEHGTGLQFRLAGVLGGRLKCQKTQEKTG
jgi:tryptophan synthase beta subunit